MSYDTFKTGPRKGQPKTQADRAIRYLDECLGCAEVVTHGSGRTSRRRFGSRRFVGMFYFVGIRGSIRFGPTFSDSVSITDEMKKNILIWEENKK